MSYDEEERNTEWAKHMRDKNIIDAIALFPPPILIAVFIMAIIGVIIQECCF